ncbi:transcriptional regulator, LuxR family [Leptospira fainei serovar Hurstbridge str. BUT 6]|uniref:Transcriptional regulator, LuxR family n=2 Tax=Leptospira fainei TaxID=48782 RepID=S3W7X1_9LEPT|nr:transcriptional regulator, LuxR family [Leptospira fainei serovar Hurstbridge str. BUT 6]
MEVLSIEQISFYKTGFSVQVNFIEVLLGISSIVIFFNLYLELSNARKLVKEAEISLSRQTMKLNFPRGTQLGEEFWRSVKLQFGRWELTPSEQELAKYLLRGFSNPQIAAIRKKSLRTIENQTLSIYRKTGMTGKLEFIAYFIEPLLPEEEDD